MIKNRQALHLTLQVVEAFPKERGLSTVRIDPHYLGQKIIPAKTLVEITNSPNETRKIGALVFPCKSIDLRISILLYIFSKIQYPKKKFPRYYLSRFGRPEKIERKKFINLKALQSHLLIFSIRRQDSSCFHMCHKD